MHITFYKIENIGVLSYYFIFGWYILDVTCKNEIKEQNYSWLW